MSLSPSLPRSRSGGRILVDQLLAQGVDRVSCVPGESFLAVLDALYDTDIDVLTCRAEGGAALMAEAYGKLTGRPGICFVTRGPGATNAAAGIHVARQDSTPMILFVGQVETSMRDREAFQELDYRAVFGSLAKWATEIDRPERIPEVVARAWRVALQGRPGPVVVALPEDVLGAEVVVPNVPCLEPAQAAVDDDDLERLRKLLNEAKRPIAIVGGSGWSAKAVADMEAFALAWRIPVATSFRRTDRFGWRHPCYAGDLGIAPDPDLTHRIKEADLVLLVGGRLSEVPSSSYTLLDVPVPRQTLVHVHPDVEELGRVYQPALAIAASPGRFCAKLKGLCPPADPPWSSETARAHASYLARSETPRTLPGAFQYGEIIVWLRERLASGGILCNGAGNFAGWVHRHYRYSGLGTQLAPTSGTMGYGVPAAVMAKRQHPDRIVVAIAGDGDFLMTGQELATAVQFAIPVVVVVIDNGQYGTIRMHQERAYPGRPSATFLNNPDFAALARTYGAHGETVRRTDEFVPAFERAVASAQPAVIHCHLDARALSVGSDLPAVAT